MSQLTLLGMPLSNYVWTCRIACTEKGVDYVLQPARPHSPEILAINPLGKMPAMQHGDVRLSESRAICGYIDRMFGGPALIPASAEAAAQVEQWISVLNTSITPLFTQQYARAYFFPGTPDNQPDRAKIDAATPKMPAMFALLDTQIAKSGFLAGSSFTLADAFLTPVLYYMKQLPESGAMLQSATHVASYLERMMQRPSIASTPPQLQR